MGKWEVGLLITATLLGSALMTLAVGHWGDALAASLVAGRGAAHDGHRLLPAGLSDFWPLIIVAFFGTINPSAGDVSVSCRCEHARLAGSQEPHHVTLLKVLAGLAILPSGPLLPRFDAAYCMRST